ncbi:hypothetical protein BC832DRAFT_86845 [Gaertneriomyces semiglobifer]|nr:hypothetical protein BC832DRAFT_86845 [Gaertneriomyces semiglobifer]
MPDTNPFIHLFQSSTATSQVLSTLTTPQRRGTLHHFTPRRPTNGSGQRPTPPPRRYQIATTGLLPVPSKPSQAPACVLKQSDKEALNQNTTLQVTCLICHTHLVQSVLVPCGHIAFCEECIRKSCEGQRADQYEGRLPVVSRCPLCRVPVESVVRFYVCGGDSE